MVQQVLLLKCAAEEGILDEMFVAPLKRKYEEVFCKESPIHTHVEQAQWVFALEQKSMQNIVVTGCVPVLCKLPVTDGAQCLFFAVSPLLEHDFDDLEHADKGYLL